MITLITNDLDENINDRRKKHLERNNSTLTNTQNHMPEFCVQLISEIYQNEIMTLTQLDDILLTSHYIPDIMNGLLNISFELEKESEMAESCLNKVSQSEIIAEFFKSCILPRCHQPQTRYFISEECLKHIEESNYSTIFSSCVDSNPNEDMWPFILRMKEGFAENSLHLLSRGIFPPN